MKPPCENLISSELEEQESRHEEQSLCARSADAVLCCTRNGPERAGPHLRADHKHRWATLTVTNSDTHTIFVRPRAAGAHRLERTLDVRTIKDGDVIAIDEREWANRFRRTPRPFAHGANAPAQRKLVANPNATRYLGVVTAAERPQMASRSPSICKNGGQNTGRAHKQHPALPQRDRNMAEVKPGQFVMANANRGDSGKLVSGFHHHREEFSRPIDIGD